MRSKYRFFGARGERILRSVFMGMILAFGFIIPVRAAGDVDLLITKSHVGNFSQGETGKVYKITVTNSGIAPTDGSTITVTDTLPVGLTATDITGVGWSCTLATLTCMRTEVLNEAASFPVINVTVNVAANAPASVTNSAAVTGGGSETDMDNNTANDITTVVQLPDLVITDVVFSPAIPEAYQPFNVVITVKNQGSADTGSIVYRDVYIDRDPAEIIDPGTGCPDDDGDYFRSDLNDGLPPGVEDTKSVEVSAGLASGFHQIWVYADATCIVEGEISESNNAFGPINISVGSKALGDTKGDYDGDGKDDVAVFRPSNGTWYVSGQGSYAFGQSGDIPVPADYNGDGKDDIAVFRPSTSTWLIKDQGTFVYGAVGDIPVPADYNGDGKADIAIFRPTNSTWYLYGIGPRVYGTVGDIPVVADYDGDGKADIAVFRPTNSTWYLYGIGPRVYGTVGDIPVVADYNGDGKADIAVFRPTNSTWYLYGVGPRVYGTVGDIPVIGDYNGDGKADVAVFRPTNSTWYLYGVGPRIYGTVGDIPV